MFSPKSLFLFLLFSVSIFGCFNEPSSSLESKRDDLVVGRHSEKIDGPANIRDTIGGTILFELPDGFEVEVFAEHGDWYEIAACFTLPKESITPDHSIEKGATLLVTDDGNPRFAMQELETWWDIEKRDSLLLDVSGFTHRQNIKPSSIPEREVERFLKEGKRGIADLQPLIQAFHFQDFGMAVPGYEDLVQYSIPVSWYADPSPLDRLRLIFRDGRLLAIQHTWELKVKGCEDFPLIRDHKLLVVGELNGDELRRFRQAVWSSYQGID